MSDLTSSDGEPINPEMSVVFLLESGRPVVHGGPYPQSHARNIRDDMRRHVQNGNHSMWSIPKTTAHVVAITDEILWQVEKRYHKRIVAADGGKSTKEDNTPSYENVSDALFETLAALVDIQERINGGAQRSNVPPEQVIREVWEAYDLEEASEIFSQTDHKRSNAADPRDFAITERGVSNRPDANN